VRSQRRISGKEGESASKMPMALCVTVFRCFVKRSFESNSRPRYLMCGLQGISVRRERSDGGGGGRRLVKSMAAVLVIFTWSFHLVKYLCNTVIAWLSRHTMVSVHQD